MASTTLFFCFFFYLGTQVPCLWNTSRKKRVTLTKKNKSWCELDTLIPELRHKGGRWIDEGFQVPSFPVNLKSKSTIVYTSTYSNKQHIYAKCSELSLLLSYTSKEQRSREKSNKKIYRGEIAFNGRRLSLKYL